MKKSPLQHQQQEHKNGTTVLNESTALLPLREAVSSSSSSMRGAQQQQRRVECWKSTTNTSIPLGSVLVTIALVILVATITAGTHSIQYYTTNKATAEISKECRDSTNENDCDTTTFLPTLSATNATTAPWDYIVVGAGPAGIITAVELANALPHCRVLLLEAGTHSQASVLTNLKKRSSFQRQARARHDSTRQQEQQSPSFFSMNAYDVPLLWSGVAASGAASEAPSNAKTPHNAPWSHTTQQQSQSLLLSSSFQNHHHWPIGRTLLGKAIGGSGVHNAMVYVRSLLSDWERWNVTGWDYGRDILPIYQQLEHFPNEKLDSTNEMPNGGYHGPKMWTVSAQALDQIDAIAPLFVQSAIHAGFPSKIETGFNNRHSSSRLTTETTTATHNEHDSDIDRVGVGYYEFNIRNGVRDSVAKALLGEHAPPLPDNLVIESGVTVTRVLLSRPYRNNNVKDFVQEGKSAPLARAMGVEFVRTATDCDKMRATPRMGGIGQVRLQTDPEKNGRVRGAVILAAGAILTPQLLANSGIGDHVSDDILPALRNKDEVVEHSENEDSTREASIRVHLPGVGKNLHDHPVVTMGFEIDAEIALMGGASSTYTIGIEMDEYYLSAMQLSRPDLWINQDATTTTTDAAPPFLGTIGTPGFAAGGFLRSPFAQASDLSPDIQLTVFPRHMEPHVARQTQRGHGGDVWLLRNKAMLVTVALLKPEARFEVKPSQSHIPLVSFDDYFSGDNDHEDKTLQRILSYRLPEIDLLRGQKQYLTELDVKRLAWGLEQVRRIQATAPLANQTGPELYPGVGVHGRDLEDYVREKSLPNAHWAGTTRMSSLSDIEDELAVVDERLRVRKVDNLRIVDAGVLPAVPNGNIHSTVCVVASRAAALIAEDRLLPENK